MEKASLRRRKLFPGSGRSGIFKLLNRVVSSMPLSQIAVGGVKRIGTLKPFEVAAPRGELKSFPYCFSGAPACVMELFSDRALGRSLSRRATRTNHRMSELVRRNLCPQALSKFHSSTNASKWKRDLFMWNFLGENPLRNENPRLRFRRPPFFRPSSIFLPRGRKIISAEEKF